MQTDAKYDPLRLGTVRVDLVHGLLELDGRRQGVDGAGEFHERPIADQLDQPATISGECRLEARGSMLAHSRQCSALVAPHQAGVAEDVGGETGRTCALLT